MDDLRCIPVYQPYGTFMTSYMCMLSVPSGQKESHTYHTDAILAISLLH